MMDKCGGGGFIPERVVTPILTHAMTRRVGGREREREEDRQTESDGLMWRKDKGTRERQRKEKKKRGLTCFNFSQQ